MSQWCVETIRADGTIVDSEIFTSFQDAWAYSMCEAVDDQWRMFSKKTALEHFYEQAPLADQPGIIRPDCLRFKVAWRADESLSVWISVI